jgi:pyruvate ferredoxin oxidoreductase delta subunit
MKRPDIKPYQRPRHIRDYPVGPGFEAGHLVTENAAWRVVAPEIDAVKCTRCLRCYLYCPEGSISNTGEVPGIDFRFCKGCGICAVECRPGAIVMGKENGRDGR